MNSHTKQHLISLNICYFFQFFSGFVYLYNHLARLCSNDTKTFTAALRWQSMEQAIIFQCKTTIRNTIDWCGNCAPENNQEPLFWWRNTSIFQYQSTTVCFTNIPRSDKKEDPAYSIYRTRKSTCELCACYGVSAFSQIRNTVFSYAIFFYRKRLCCCS